MRLLFVKLNVREEDWMNVVEGSGGSKEWLWPLQILGGTSGSHNKEQKIFTLPCEDLVSFCTNFIGFTILSNSITFVIQYLHPVPTLKWPSV